MYGANGVPLQTLVRFPWGVVRQIIQLTPFAEPKRKRVGTEPNDFGTLAFLPDKIAT